VDYKDTDICICGHPFENHNCHEDSFCLECLFSDGLYGNGEKECDCFKLDNLRYIEDEAKKQGLI